MLEKSLDTIHKTDIEHLINNGVSEGRQLEFKRDHYGRKDSDKREFAADISAFANSSGGDLIIGVREEKGVAKELVGVKCDDPDQLILMITESLRTSIEPKIQGVGVKWLPIREGSGLIFIRVPRSWAAPHRVVVAKDYRFFIRDENGKHPMGVEELRRSFVFENSLEEKIRNFRKSRLQLLETDQAAFAVDAELPLLVVHAIPQISYLQKYQIDLSNNVYARPVGASGWNTVRSIDGIVSYSGPEDKVDQVRAFSTLFLNGCMESVVSLYVGEKNDRRHISMTGLESYVLQAINDAENVFNKLDIGAPYYVMVTLCRVRNIHAPSDDRFDRVTYPCRRSTLILPDILIKNITENNSMNLQMRPIMDLLWNAFGHTKSPSYK